MNLKQKHNENLDENLNNKKSNSEKDSIPFDYNYVKYWKNYVEIKTVLLKGPDGMFQMEFLFSPKIVISAITVKIF